ncbi:glycosyltransferase family 5 protein [Lophiostoma macrostomum CBS 122681]|uniref:alpha-1,3-glucan synthase n=1 Tax=Lophiostoma macrostomum CBS 122681 TaxID=1314788 RepID=A0A6A6TP36_9PLEO|nr:glycosyltransferase family 5 protein [Lophiostoma macrostomum CBS 122681]
MGVFAFFTRSFSFLLITFHVSLVWGLQFDPLYQDYNLNQKVGATNPSDYWGEWEDHSYNPSPGNWRFPFYTLFLDRFVNGDPTNDNANKTVFEQDITSTQLRHGGDVQGLLDTLDYIQGFGIKGIYIAGSPFINQPWVADSYSPLDHTLLDQHFGNIAQWRSAIEEIHRRGMYIILDNTFATMGDLVGFEGYLNESTPFNTQEWPVQWKSDRRYHDFNIGFDYNDTCDFPRMWSEDGKPVGQDVASQFKGCFNGDFDQFGDTEAFGVFPDYRRQLTKFASVQDRLREWVPSVRTKLETFSCITIAMLDIDGFRFDKATQATIDASGSFAASLRDCARKFGKENFFLPGEITGGNTFGSLYVGRGRQPDHYITNLTVAALVTNETIEQLDVKFLRDEGQNALDAAAFHYSIYRFLTRFLGMDGNLEAGFDLPRNWVDGWNEMLLTNDFLNPNTGEVDPRHMYGVTNQDVFRWPAISQGVERMLLGQFITTLHMPGIPLLLWGEEQAFYHLDNTADNYIYGRQPISSSPAWQMHGCYAGSSTQYFKMPLDRALTGCQDEQTAWDHRDPSHPVRNILKALFHLRENFPALNDGLFLQQLSNHTGSIQMPGSSGTETEMGLWSVMRAAFAGVQDFGSSPPVWLVYHNRNETTEYDFKCDSNDSALVAPYPSGTTVKNLLFPHDELTLGDSPFKLGINGSTDFNGCNSNLSMLPYEFRAYVPKDDFIPPPVMITKFLPGHDQRIQSTGDNNTVKVEFHVSVEMNCDNFTAAIDFTSVTQTGEVPRVDASTVTCSNVSNSERAPYIGAVASAWKWSASIINLSDGIHQIVVRNATTADLGSHTNSNDPFLLRVGGSNNPLVYPISGNYSDSLLTQDNSGNFALHHSAAGASQWRYSLNWGSTWSDWAAYQSKGGADSIDKQVWSGTELQEWDGHHVIVQYWSQLLGSSSFVQHGHIGESAPRRLPHLWANGAFNQFGFDAGLKNQLKLTTQSQWEWHFMAEWPSSFQLNTWGINPDGQPDQTFVYGDIDADFVLDRLPPSSLVQNVVKIAQTPPHPHLAYRFALNDGTLRYELIPEGNQWVQLALYLLLWLVPAISGTLVVLGFKGSFYKVKFVVKGAGAARTFFDPVLQRARVFISPVIAKFKSHEDQAVVAAQTRRTVLIGTLEYNIDDWQIKIKIGGLGVMAQLMGSSLKHQDLIWVVPCVGGIDYPIDTVAEPMLVTIMGQSFEVKVQYHKVDNITYVLLDAPVFRKQTKAEPYPPRMDDMESAIYYSAWNQCIALTANRFPIDLYHINDYHGAAALLYLLPKTLPACLSLHNAEFQGMWPMRTPAESKEVCEVFNLSPEIVSSYVQYGAVFNLLHAGASYLRIHQKGFGAVGVSKKYGYRSYARYPIFWGLDSIGQLPNPDPSDTAEWNPNAIISEKDVAISQEFEDGRAGLKRQAQEWAGLDTNPGAELFVFVGRWSLQKGIDLIADIFPTIMEENDNVQLICVGPVIDLYGKFAALKLEKLVERYPGRVYSKPEFTALPPFIFSGAEFALIPSRDEPFGLVAVEFGRKGALGVGARVGGLGTMPGWWYTVESTSASHLLHQFKNAIVSALECKPDTRALMRAWSAKQRFPVAQWISLLEKLQSTSIKLHYKPKSRPRTLMQSVYLRPKSSQHTPHSGSPTDTEFGTRVHSTAHSRNTSLAHSRAQSIEDIDTLALPPVPPIPFADSGTSTPTGAQTPNRLSVPVSPFIQSPNISTLSVNSVVGDRNDYKLQTVEPFFTDSRGDFYKEFEQKLRNLNARNSTADLCIEAYLTKSEKAWFDMYRGVKLGRPSYYPLASTDALVTPATTRPNSIELQDAKESRVLVDKEDFGLSDEYVAPTGLKKYLQYRVGSWPIYSILIAIGQVISSNSYQITLLTGEVGQTASKLYVVASIYLGTTMIWYAMSRRLQSIYALSIPFFLYGSAFIILGASPFAKSISSKGWMQNVATGLYAAASSSGAISFASNFGDEGASPVSIWMKRATIIQGIQQLYSLGLWYWGSLISSASAAGQLQQHSLANSPYLLAVCLPIALFLWAAGTALFLGLPDYYRQTPGAVPTLWRSLMKRRTITWYLFAVVIQNYFLSAPYGRNWFFLFSSQHVHPWVIALLALVFFGLGWVALMFGLSLVSRSHPWLFPLFAVGLGAPRWAQMLWGTSGIGLYVPWAGSAAAGAIASRCVWLWLGLLDGVQNAGIGMILMLTLTRVHVASAVVAAQVLGSLATIVARATAPDRLGPADVFPDFSEGVAVAASKAWFWVVMILQIGICVGYFKFFRKEQVSKP